ncbi:Tripartite-type tricarboxylate transporter, receptor component TctC [Alteribacillus persepolensis]|uniref:Tripartite-type tricarboxylate transporter, receptor component TctC n=1 Tax=Alteribacillus persepolensis TaxID=568899 RepID=A0A1G8EFF9_9BACI|nr:tripartite tricarboxylate transporter substrate binding protein [Alteribacillus persepolensis]SDH68643.1 Tripartite-type tricarboxylate transporter, receptor component TctC [Alteribacillus persepolensis]
MRTKQWMAVMVLVFIVLLAACTEGEKEEEDNNKETGTAEETSAEAADYPKRDIEIIAGGGAGGGTDVYSRAVARELSDILGTNVNVVNKPGGGGSVAAQEVATAPADGYTLLPTNSDTQVNMATGKSPNYIEDNVFSGLARMHDDTYALMVKSGTFANIEEFIEHVQENPGEVSIGGTASMGTDELTVAKFEKAAGIDLNYVAYEDAGQMHADLAGGHVDVLLEEPGPALSLLEEGEFEMLVIFAEERVEEYPDVPTSVESGWDIVSGMSRGFIVHADVPGDIKKILEDALEQTLETERYQEFVESQYLHLKDGWMNSEDYQSFLEEEINVYKDLSEELNQQ